MTVNIGIIGLGWMGQLHAKYLERVEGCRLAAVCDRDAGKLNDVKSRYQIDGYEDYYGLLENKNIDTIFIVTPQKYHYQIVKDCIEAGKNILCEKPLALTREEINSMRSLVNKSKGKFIVNFPERFAVSAQEAKDVIDAGSIGGIDYIRANFRFSMKAHGETHGGWVFDRSQGGGLIIESSVHLWDAVRWISGKEIIDVIAVAHEYTKNGVPLEDNFAAIAHLEGGGIVCIDMSGSMPRNSATDKRFEILGSEGCIYLDEFRNFMTVDSENGIENNPGMIATGMTHKDLMWHSSIEGGVKRLQQYFIKCIKEDMVPEPGVEDGARACEITWAIIESLKSGKLEKVHYGTEKD